MSISFGQVVWSAFKPIIKIYLIIGLGILLAKLEIITAQATKIISDLILSVFLPCLAFAKIVSNIEGKDIKEVGVICLTAVMLYMTALFFSLMVRTFLPVPKRWYGGILATGTFQNASDLPIAYIQTMANGFVFTAQEGEKGVACIIIFMAMFMLCVFNLGGFRLIEMDFINEKKTSEEEDVDDKSASLELSLNTNPSTSSSDLEKNPNFSNVIYSEREHNNSSISSQHQIPTTYLSSDKINKETFSPKEFLNPIPCYCSVRSTDTNINLFPESINTSNNYQNSITVQENQSYQNTLHNSNISSNSNHTIFPFNGPSNVPTNKVDKPSLSNKNHNPNMEFTPIALENPSEDGLTSETNWNETPCTSPMTYNTQGSIYSKLENIRAKRRRKGKHPNELVIAYSHIDRQKQLQKYNGITTLDRAVEHFYSPESDDLHKTLLDKIKSSDLKRILMSEADVTDQDFRNSGKNFPAFIRVFNINSFIIFFLKNCFRPCSLAVIIGLTIAFIPWLKELFVTTPHTPYIHPAPDMEPPLNVLLSFTAYIGDACVPFGLLILGATLGTLQIGRLYPGFWKAAIVLVVIKLCIMPIFGILWCDRLIKAGWLSWESDEMLLFVIALNWGLPSMTAAIYFTASSTPIDSPDPIQMECVSFFLMLQYPIIVITMPFLVTYFLKVQVKV
ncbi:hypothetical protein TBLA_0B01500 [Henningerozyma blattae CBS 6284]|uniref:Uncharacterized protein n=1 Tax=Henningerozyma blattae (strain ATCC 34711 / CBS 6284 / DSM 70876 / NBRC 10599 / NRRL Y-10934 / UCD 77-7) TaxID=1071380 RepID=I2GXZ1_HENB6|nr:hypothetical protein TBLA_0B01500 [Tetrapisispora blattae CBS 6284]CCH58993.1 hypothetical protein TBLA_0B01500 [Tetrapisispora blattae CBS 6284]